MDSNKISSDADASEGSGQDDSSEHEALISLIDDFVWKADLRGRMIEDCPTWREFTGQTTEAWIGDGWMSEIHPDDLPEIKEEFTEVRQRIGAIELEFRLRHWSGNWANVVMRAKPIVDSETGGVSRWVGILKRRPSEEQQRRSAETLDAVLEALPVGVIIADDEGKVLRYNRANRELWGIPPETKGWDEHVNWVGYHPDSGRRIEVEEWAMSRAVKKGEIVQGQYVEVERFGTKERRLVLNNGAPIVDRDENVVGGVVAQLDITERVEAEKELQKQQKWFQHLADNMAQLAWMADSDGEIFWYNQRWFDYTGTHLEEMKGWGWMKVHHPDHIDRVVRRLKRCWESGEPWEDTFPLRGKDGSYRWFLSRAQPVCGEDGKVVRWFGTNTDITFQRISEEALKDADRRKDEFLATLAHELRNPLAPIRTGLEVIKMAEGNQEIIEKVRGTMENQTLQLVRLIEDLLDVSRITRGKLELRRSQFPLDEVLQLAVETVEPNIESRGHKLEMEISDPDLVLNADSSRLAQMISNLLGNAARYTSEGGQITLRTWEEDGNLMLSVRDNGRGISPDFQKRIFDMFTQGGLDSDRSGGLGIGLTLVRSLAGLHGGSVWMESEGEGKGSLFTLCLPILAESVEASDAPDRERRPSTNGATRLRVLVVDDNVAAADTLTTLVKLHSHDVQTVHEGKLALDVARQFHPDLVLMDLGMPEMSGFEVARRMRQEQWAENLVLVAVSGWGQEEARKRSQEAGFDKHLVKGDEPVSLAKILEEMAHLKRVAHNDED